MRHNYIGTEHLLLGLIREEGGVAGRVLRELGLETRRVQEMVQRLTGTGQYRGGKIDLSPGTQQVLEYAFEEAKRMGHHYIGTEHILLGLVNYGEGIALNVLQNLGLPQSKSDAKRNAFYKKVVPRGEPLPEGGSRKDNKIKRKSKPRWWINLPPT